MKPFLSLPLLFLVIGYCLLHAQPAFEVNDLEGTAKVQRVQKQKWEKISVGTKLADNDIIETYFQTRISIKMADGTVVLFGSNSKALLNISYREISGRKTTNASFSLFNGGMLTKAVDKAKVSVFTTNAVGEIDSGTLAIVVDTKSGETGFLSLGGKATIRNISQQKGIKLEAGYTTIVIPGREPAPPLSLSFRHVGILRHFFGDKLITDELHASSITPANDQSSGSGRATVSAGFGGNDKQRVSIMSYPRVFNVRKIYGSILDDRENREPLYRPIVQPDFAVDARGSAELQSNIGITDNPSTLFALVPKYRFPYADVGLRFAFGDDFQSHTVTGFNSLAAAFDKIEHITAGRVEDSLYMTAGALSGITFANGAVIDHFRNVANNSVYHPFGLAGTAELIDHIKINAFLANATTPSLMGIHGAFELSYYSVGVGYYYDPDQYYQARDSGDLRYSRPKISDSLFQDPSTNAGQLNMYELNFCAVFAQNYNFLSRALLDFVQKRENGMNDGYIIRPSITVDIPFYSIGSGFIVESGRIVSGEFDEFYNSRHSWIKHGPGYDTLLTDNTSLSKRRIVSSLFLNVKANPIKDIAVDLGYTQAIRSKNAYVAWASTDTHTVSTPLDYSVRFRCSANDKLIPYVSYASVYLTQSHALLYPHSGGFFTSWNSEAGFDCSSKPLYRNFSLMIGGRFFSLDKGPLPNDKIDAADRVFELTASIRWDFM